MDSTSVKNFLQTEWPAIWESILAKEKPSEAEFALGVAGLNFNVYSILCYALNYPILSDDEVRGMTLDWNTLSPQLLNSRRIFDYKKTAAEPFRGILELIEKNTVPKKMISLMEFFMESTDTAEHESKLSLFRDRALSIRHKRLAGFLRYETVTPDLVDIAHNQDTLFNTAMHFFYENEIMNKKLEEMNLLTSVQNAAAQTQSRFAAGGMELDTEPDFQQMQHNLDQFSSTFTGYISQMRDHCAGRVARDASWQQMFEECQQAKNQLSTLQETFDQTQQELKKTTQERDQLQGYFDASETMRKQVQEEFNASERQLEKLRKDAEASEQLRKYAEAECAKLGEQLRKFAKDSAKLCEQLRKDAEASEQLRKDLESSKEMEKDLRASLKASENKLGQKDQDLKAVEDNFSSARKKCWNAEAELHKAQETIQKLQSEKEQLATEIGASSLSNMSTDKELHAEKAKSRKLAEKLRECQKTLKETEEKIQQRDEFFSAMSDVSTLVMSLSQKLSDKKIMPSGSSASMAATAALKPTAPAKPPGGGKSAAGGGKDDDNDDKDDDDKGDDNDGDKGDDNMGDDKGDDKGDDDKGDDDKGDDDKGDDDKGDDDKGGDKGDDNMGDDKGKGHLEATEDEDQDDSEDDEHDPENPEVIVIEDQTQPTKRCRKALMTTTSNKKSKVDDKAGSNSKGGASRSRAGGSKTSAQVAARPESSPKKKGKSPRARGDKSNPTPEEIEAAISAERAVDFKTFTFDGVCGEEKREVFRYLRAFSGFTNERLLVFLYKFYGKRMQMNLLDGSWSRVAKDMLPVIASLRYEKVPFDLSTMDQASHDRYIRGDVKFQQYDDTLTKFMERVVTAELDFACPFAGIPVDTHP